MAQLITSASIEIPHFRACLAVREDGHLVAIQGLGIPKVQVICTVMAIVSWFIWLIHAYTTHKNGDDWGMLYQYGEITAYDDKPYIVMAIYKWLMVIMCG